MALLVEIGASLGLFLASGHGRRRKIAHAPPAELPLGSVEDFALEALVPSSGALSAEAAATAYDAWCLDRSYRPLPPAAFQTSFEYLARQAGIECRENSFRRIGVATTALRRAA